MEKKMNIRIGDPERTRYLNHLNTMYSTGYLTKEEYDERSGQVNECKFINELVQLVSDLPQIPSDNIIVAEEKKPDSIYHRNLHGGKFRISTWVGGTLGFALTAAMVPTYNSARFIGFASGGPFVLILNLTTLVVGIVGALVCLIALAPE
jgi:Domain of unknown function (DUF1707)